MPKEVIIFLFILLGFGGFCIYFIFKVLQFFIQATNLYKSMIKRQDLMIKLLSIQTGEELPQSKGDPSAISLDGNSNVNGSFQYKCEKCDMEFSDNDGSLQFCDICGAKLEVN